MKKMLFVCVGLLVVGSLAFAAGQQEAADGDSLAGEIAFWQSYPAVNEAYQDYAQEYMEQNPEAKITLSLFTARAFDDKLNTAMPAGTAGDILEGWDGQMWAYISAGLIAEPPQHVLDYYRETTMDFLQTDDVYAIPTFAGLKFLFWNKDHFAEAGLDGPPTTIDEQMEYARKLTVYDSSGDPERAGLAFRLSGGGYGVAEKWWFKTLGPMGLSPIEETGDRKWASNMDTEEAVDSVQYYLDALYNYRVDGFNIERDIPAFAKGNASMIQKESQAIPFLADNAPDLDYGIAPIPGDEIDGTLAVVIQNYVNEDTENKELAWDIIKFFNAPDRHRNTFLQTGWNPVRGDIDYESVYEEKPEYRGLMDFPEGYEAYFYPANDSWSEIWPKTGEWLTNIYTREDLADDRAALRAECEAFAEEVNRLLEENNEYAPK